MESLPLIDGRGLSAKCTPRLRAPMCLHHDRTWLQIQLRTLVPNPPWGARGRAGAFTSSSVTGLTSARGRIVCLQAVDTCLRAYRDFRIATAWLRAPSRSTLSHRSRFSLHRRLTGRLWWDRPHPLFRTRQIHGHSPRPQGSPCGSGQNLKRVLPRMTRPAAISQALAGPGSRSPHLRSSLCGDERPPPAQWVNCASFDRSRVTHRRVHGLPRSCRGAGQLCDARRFPGYPGLS